PRADEPGVSGRDLGAARAGRRGPSRRHAARPGRGCRDRPLSRGEGASGRRRSSRDAPAACRRRAADHAGRRRRLERCRLRRHRPFRDGQRPPSVLLVPPPGHRRQSARLLCRRSRNRRGTEPRRADQGSRSRARGRGADRRDHLARLHAPRHPRSRQNPGPCSCGGRGIGPRVPPDCRDPVGHAGIRRSGTALEPIANPRWRTWRAEARAEYEKGLDPTRFTEAPVLDLGQIMTWLRERLPDDAIVTSDAGNFSGWPNRFLQYRRPGRPRGPTAGALGYGVPAAVAAKLTYPGRIVVGFCGDGGFMMTGQELATAVGEGIGPIILLFNNAMYGTIRMHQERRFPGRVVGRPLRNQIFGAWIAAYGGFG